MENFISGKSDNWVSNYCGGVHIINHVTPALVFRVVLCVLCLYVVSVCWPRPCLSSNLTISVCLFGILEFCFSNNSFVIILIQTSEKFQHNFLNISITTFHKW